MIYPEWSISKEKIMAEGLVYVGKVVNLDPIKNADFIACATVVCGKGGKWKGVIRKQDIALNDRCLVYLPDALIPPNEEMKFMESSGWRVKMQRFKGAPSEVVIMPYIGPEEVGCDLTEWTGVTKYHKPIPTHLQGISKGPFPSFIPKTDELNYQRHFDLVEQLHGQHYYITEKVDGSSTTAFRYKGQFGLCSRNLELERNEKNGYWKVAMKYQLEEKLPEGYALQWETCGPGIQSNPMGLTDIDGFAFSAYKIDEHRYLEMTELWSLLDGLKFPSCRVLKVDSQFDKSIVENLGEGKYSNGKQREGVVVRSQLNYGYAPISFKVINLNYEK